MLKAVAPELDDELYNELIGYLCDHWRTAKEERRTQVDSDHTRWDMIYRSVPKQKERTMPWPGASNLVVPLARIFVDTAVARSLNVMFATRPIIAVKDTPKEISVPLETFANMKANTSWDFYSLARDVLFAGNKDGTAVTKTFYNVEEAEIVRALLDQPHKAQTYTYSKGAKAEVVPFDDLYVFPITARKREDVRIWFHQLRYPVDEARRFVQTAEWGLAEVSDLENMAKPISDAQRQKEMSDAGLQSNHLREIKPVEAFLRYPVTPDKTKLSPIKVLFDYDTQTILDIEYYPFYMQSFGFSDYRPFRRDKLWHGESMCGILAAIQEEASHIHNSRRDNTTLANMPYFKRKAGSTVPDSSSHMYPGIMLTLDDIDDFQADTVGRALDPMLEEENYLTQMAERLTGIGAIMQGSSQGMSGKRGVYNAQGTLAILSESNQRQNTYLRDIRSAMGATARDLTYIELEMVEAANDPMFNLMHPERASELQQVLEVLKPEDLAKLNIDMGTSNAAVNVEMRRQNIIQASGLLTQYGGQVQQLVVPLLDPNLNPVMKTLLSQLISLYKDMAATALRAFEEYDLEGELPDVLRALEEQAAAQGGPGQTLPEGDDVQGMDGAQQDFSRADMEQLASLPAMAG